MDECHHAEKKHPYKQIMDRYAEIRERGAPVPRILGLSASIVTKKVNSHKFKEEKTRLERTLHAKIITTENLADLLKHVTAPQERMHVYDNLGYHFAEQVEIN